MELKKVNEQMVRDVRYFRNELRLSQQRTANLTGVSRRTLQLIEQGGYTVRGYVRAMHTYKGIYWWSPAVRMIARSYLKITVRWIR